MLKALIARLRAAGADARARAAVAAVCSLAPDEFDRVTFFKLDEVTTDLICCTVQTRDGKAFTLHEEMEGWDRALAHLEQLPGFRRDWFDAVFKPPFARSETVAFSRSGAPGPPD